MAQITVLRGISSETTSTGTYVGQADSITIQCNPDANQGFDGTIAVDAAFVPNLNDIIFPIATLKIPPWFQVATLGFAAHTGVLAFTIGLSKQWTWIRARVVTANVGSVSVHMAY
jgi:hypothetical protein